MSTYREHLEHHRLRTRRQLLRLHQILLRLKITNI